MEILDDAESTLDSGIASPIHLQRYTIEEDQTIHIDLERR